MPAVYQLRFMPGGETQKIYGSRGDHYEMANGTHIDLHSSPVWCRQCMKFTDGESIEALEEIDRQIAELRDPTSELFRFYRESGADSIGVEGIRFITKLETRRRWRDRREAPPKCLECGSTEIVVLPEGQKSEEPGRHRLGRGHDHGPLQHLLQQPLLHAGRRPYRQGHQTDVLDVALILGA